MGAVLLTLEGKKIQLGEIETISCQGCGKRVVRNINSPAFMSDSENYYYCSECQKNLKREWKWIGGLKISVRQLKKQ